MPPVYRLKSDDSSVSGHLYSMNERKTACFDSLETNTISPSIPFKLPHLGFPHLVNVSLLNPTNSLTAKLILLLPVKYQRIQTIFPNFLLLNALPLSFIRPHRCCQRAGLSYQVVSPLDALTSAVNSWHVVGSKKQLLSLSEGGRAALRLFDIQCIETKNAQFMPKPAV